MASYPRKVLLPAGKVGLGFKGTPAVIKTVADDCPVGDQIKIGDQVIHFSVAGACEISGLNIPSTLLGEHLKAHADSSERVIYVWEEGAQLQPEAPRDLPNGKNVMPGGVWWKRYRDMADSVNLGETGGKDQSFASVSIYKEPGERGRWLNTYGSQTRPGDEEFPFAIPSKAGRMDCTYKVWLPAGKVGVSFKYTPPTVSKIADTSPLFGKIKLGQHIVECALGDEVVMEGNDLSYESVGQFLMDNADSTERSIKLTVKNDAPSSVSSSTRSVAAPAAAMAAATTTAAAAAVVSAKVADSDPIPGPSTTYTVSLPEGVAGISFKGVPCRISRVTPGGPMSQAGIAIGQQIVACAVGGKVLLSGNNLTSIEVGHFLRDHAKSGAERTLTLTIDSDTAFAQEQQNLRSSMVAVNYEYELPPGAKKGGKWLYKEPGLLGRVVTKTGAPVVYGFTLLVEI